MDEITRLQNLIRDLRSGSLDVNQFEPFLPVAIQAQKAKTGAMQAGLGKVVDVSFVGPQDGGDVFKVTFEHGVVAGGIRIAANGKIAGLRAIPADAPRIKEDYRAAKLDRLEPKAFSHDTG